MTLKEIQQRFADRDESRERFKREAEITGKLEHPGIVPVYRLGQYSNGRPYYAMRFIRGVSLREAIDAFHSTYKEPFIVRCAGASVGMRDVSPSNDGAHRPEGSGAVGLVVVVGN